MEHIDYDEITSCKLTEKACNMILDLIEANPEIPPKLWAGAICTLIARLHFSSGFTYQEFHQELLNISEHFKIDWDD